MAVVAGQSTSSLLVDWAGHAPGAARPITRSRAMGAALCVVAVLVAVSDSLGDPRALWLAALPALAGVGIAWQQGVNGLVRQAAGAVLPATLINFLVGTTTLLIALGIEIALKGPPPGALPAEPWLYLGGPIGIIFIATAAGPVHPRRCPAGSPRRAPGHPSLNPPAVPACLAILREWPPLCVLWACRPGHQCKIDATPRGRGRG